MRKLTKFNIEKVFQKVQLIVICTNFVLENLD